VARKNGGSKTRRRVQSIAKFPRVDQNELQYIWLLNIGPKAGNQLDWHDWKEPWEPVDTLRKVAPLPARKVKIRRQHEKTET